MAGSGATRTSMLPRRVFLARAGAVIAACAAVPLTTVVVRARAAEFGDCDMTWDRDGRPYKGFASAREGSGGQCTTHAARRFDTVAPEPGVNWTGGARLWYGRAAAAGWYVTSDIEAARR